MPVARRTGMRGPRFPPGRRPAEVGHLHLGRLDWAPEVVAAIHQGLPSPGTTQSMRPLRAGRHRRPVPGLTVTGVVAPPTVPLPPPPPRGHPVSTLTLMLILTALAQAHHAALSGVLSLHVAALRLLGLNRWCFGLLLGITRAAAMSARMVVAVWRFVVAIRPGCARRSLSPATRPS